MTARAARETESATVIELNHDGDGIVKAGKTAFVAGALPGEAVRFERTRRHRQYDEARLLGIDQASPERVEPECPHFGVCGGCALQHLSVAGQLAHKQAEVAAALARIAKVEPAEWLAPIVSPAWRYRRRARLSARYVAKKGRALVGFRERRAPYVADIASCAVLAPPFDALITPLSGLLGSLDIREQVPQVEIAAGDAASAIVVRVLRPPTADDRAALAAFGRSHGVAIYLQPGGPESVAALDGAGSELTYALPEFAIELAFLPTDFVQVNAAVNRALVARAAALLDAGPGDAVLDLFCGLGNFTLALARRAGRVLGIEGDSSLIARARANAARNGIGNARFEVANLAVEGVGDRAWWGAGCTHVLLDPPRAGAREVLAAIARLAPRRVVYVSCHPGTLARDVGALVHEHGFELCAAGILDMFPHTAHVESMAVLEPGSSRAGTRAVAGNHRYSPP